MGRGRVNKKDANPNLGMAGVTGLEPATSCVTGMRSNQLSYTPTISGDNLTNFCFSKVNLEKLFLSGGR